MKKLEFETSKGRFVVKDLKFIELESKGIVLKQITEEQASYIVNSEMSGTVLGKLVTDLDNHRVEIYNHEGNNIKFLSAVRCLHSLLKSKGIHLFENPFKNTYSIQSLEGSQKHSKQIQEAETKTFYNPVIFKL